jgi:hypothetical protein
MGHTRQREMHSASQTPYKGLMGWLAWEGISRQPEISHQSCHKCAKRAIAISKTINGQYEGIEIGKKGMWVAGTRKLDINWINRTSTERMSNASEMPHMPQEITWRSSRGTSQTRDEKRHYGDITSQPNKRIIKDSKDSSGTRHERAQRVMAQERTSI